MKLKEVYLKNFRIFDEIDIHFKDANVIVGPNGSGKTTIIEAINYLSFFSPLRGYETDKDLVKVGESYFNILGKFERDDGTNDSIFVGYDISDGKQSKKIKLNDKRVNVFEVAGRLKVVPFLIEDYELIVGSPSWRRKTVNSFLISSNPSYYYNLLNYNKILKQKNVSLRMAKESKNSGVSYIKEKELIETYNSNIAKLAIEITKERYNFCEYVIQKMRLYLPIGINLVYKSHLKDFLEKQNSIDDCIEFLNKEIETEILYGKSVIGPHLDDFVIVFENKLAKTFLSQGQIRMVSIFFKLACADYIMYKTNSKPILLMDDILGELDEDNKNKVIQRILSLPYQVIFSFFDLSSEFDLPGKIDIESYNVIRLGK